MSRGLHLVNTLSGRRERFRPREEGKVKLFTCGPSTYARAHVGNYRTFLYEDVLQRYLEYLGLQVERLINFTDVEDKAIAEARKRGVRLKDLTGSVEDRFFEEARLLRIHLPRGIPRASTSVDQAVDLIHTLMEKGYAYRHGKDIFYDPLRFKGFGRLYGLDMSRWPRKKRRFRKDTYPGRRWNLGDFILWHGDGSDGVSWETDIGRGRPAWNIQDAAMITKHLGPRIDIACGGVDNLYRHHDYTIAIIEAVSGDLFAPYWLHGEHVLADGKKMSKSKGNIVYLEDLLQQGYSAPYLRFFLIYAHYRKPLDLTQARMERTAGKLTSAREMVRQLLSVETSAGPTSREPGKTVEGLDAVFRERMNDDLDVKGAFDAVRRDLSRLTELKMQGLFTPQHARALRAAVGRIDNVLRVFGEPDAAPS